MHLLRSFALQLHCRKGELVDEAAVTRQRVHACIHPETFKYFFPRSRVLALWAEIETRYGAPTTQGAFRIMELETEHFWLRSVIGGNPITVLRKRNCSDEAIAELHRIFGFEEGEVEAT